MKKKILYLVNKITPTSIPIEVANNLDDSFEVIIVSLYDTDIEVIKKSNENRITKRVSGLGLKNRFDLFQYKKIYDLFKDINPDIIHTHHSYSGFIGRLLAKKCRNTAIITTIHTDMRFLSLYQKIMQSINLNTADYIVCNSINTRDSFLPWQNRLIDVSKKIVIYNGVDIKRVQSYRENSSDIRQKYRIPEKAFVIGNVGRLEKAKDQQTLIRAFKLFKEKVNNSRLMIVGGGSQAEELKVLVRELKIKDEVIFTGLVSRDEAYQVINTLDLFVISSLYEGFCNAMVEAMAAGKPVIATDIAPLPEVLGYHNGLFFKQEDYNDLCSKMLVLFKDELLRKSYGEKSSSYARQNYSLEKCISEYTKLYHKVLRR